MPINDRAIVIVKKSVVLLFSGQGAQEVGMGKSLVNDFPEAKNIFKLNSLVKVKIVYTHKKHCLMCILGLFGVCAKYAANDAIQNRQNVLFGESPQFCSNFTCLRINSYISVF